MNVTQATKNAFLDTNTTKYLTVKIINSLGTNTIPQDIIIGDSMILTESILPSGDLKFGGGIPSSFEIKLYSLPDYLNVQAEDIKLEASIKAKYPTATTYSEEIPLFKGYVKELKINPMNLQVDIKAYDILYDELVNCEGDITNQNFITSWGAKKYEDVTYKEAYGEPLLVDEILSNFIYFPDYISNYDDLLANYFRWFKADDYCNMDKLPTKGETGDSFYLGAENEDDPNKNNWVNYVAQIKESYMCSFEIIKHLFEFNSLFLKNNRDSYDCKGVGCYYYTENNVRKIYRQDLSLLNTETIQYYKTVSYDNLGNTSDDPLYSIRYVESDGSYAHTLHYPLRETASDRDVLLMCVSNNTFCDQPLSWRSAGRHGAQATAFAPFMSNINYSITCQGRPWLEVGEDAIKTTIRSGLLDDDGKAITTDIGGILCTRTLKGIQNLEDTYTFSSAIAPQYEYQKKGSVGSRLDNLEKTRPKTQCVSEIPETFETNTIYFVRKNS